MPPSSIASRMSQLSVLPPLATDVLKSFRKVGAATEGEPLERALGQLNFQSEAHALAVGDGKLNDLRALIPGTYRDRLWLIIKQLYDAAKKIGNVSSSHKKLLAHKSQNTWPPSLVPRAKKPELQLSGPYKTPHGAAVEKTLSDLAVKQAGELLDVMIKTKTEELAYLLNEVLAPKNYEMVMKTALTMDLEAAKLVHGFTTPGDANITKYPEWIMVEHNRILVQAPIIASRAIELARSQTARIDLKAEGKAKLHQSVDVAMGGMDPDSPAVRKTIEQLVNERVKAALDQRKPKKPKNKGTLVEHFDTMILTNSTSRKRQREETNWGLACPEKNRKAFREEAGEQERAQTQALESHRKRRRQEAEAERIDVSQSISFHKPSSYPDEILTLPFHLQFKLLASRCPIEEIEAKMRFLPGPFVQEGISISDVIRYDLGVNLKYLYPTQWKSTLLQEAYDQLSYSVRWAWFWETRRSEVLSSYNPRFKLSFSEKREPPKMTTRLEKGLVAGWEYLKQFGDAVPPPRQKPAQGRRPDWENLKKYLDDEDLIVKETDKNLGVAIFRRDWYTTEALTQLEDDAYKPIHVSVIKDRMTRAKTEVMGLFEDPCADPLTSQEKKFLQEGITYHCDLPGWHGIPKVHKNPWKLRPIVPSYSWVTTNMAKIVQRYLQPMVANVPWIAQSTYDVVKLLNAARIPVRTGASKIFVYTGDVTAMYTNIDTTMALSQIKSLLWPEAINGEHRPDPHPCASFLYRAIRLINDHALFHFEGQPFLQAKGLTMGASCSPDIANLTCAGYENKGSCKEFREDPSTLFYVRYIDDICTAVYATSKEEADRSIARHNLGPLHITWACVAEDEGPSPFLDLSIYILPRSTHFDYKLYRKPFNRFMRIPWSSAHPVQVKKACFSSELTRIATCTSQLHDYNAAVAEYREILLARGYPSKVLHSWVRAETEKRWRSSIEQLLGKPKEASTPPTIMKSEYNTVWNDIKPSKIRDAITRAWASGPLSDSEMKFCQTFADRRMIIAYSKTRSLGDDVSSLNACITHERENQYFQWLDQGVFEGLGTPRYESETE